MSLTEKILELLPEGTRPVRWVRHQISNKTLHIYDFDVLAFARNDIKNNLEEPHIIIEINVDEFNPRLDSQFINLAPEFSHPLTIIFGFTYEPIPRYSE